MEVLMIFLSSVTVFDDALIRRAEGHSRLRLPVEVVPPNDGFVPTSRLWTAFDRHLR
jgi:hypothetical protein